jgi:hypothetical protein
MAKFICPKCHQKECIVDPLTIVDDPEMYGLKVTFKCYACSETFIAVYQIEEFWRIDKKILNEFYEHRNSMLGIKNKKIKEEIITNQQIKLF